MRMRLDATTRSPDSSSILVMAPVRLRRVASGLMIEKVRVTAMTGRSPADGLGGFGGPPSRTALRRQASCLLHPFAAVLRPITPIDPFPAGEQFPGQARAFQRAVVEQIEAAVVS